MMYTQRRTLRASQVRKLSVLRQIQYMVAIIKDLTMDFIAAISIMFVLFYLIPAVCMGVVS